MIPDYKNSIEVDRKRLINAVSLISLTANKVTNQINLHVNGAIELSSEEMDFAYESNSKIKYVAKRTPDFDYSCNAKYLLAALNALKTPTVEIYSDGESNKCIRIGNKSEVAKVLIMPIVKTY